MMIDLLEIWNEDWEERVIVYAADLERGNFGLTEEIYNTLANTIDIILHCGKLFNFFFPFQSNILFSKTSSKIYSVILFFF
jgi:thioester reductase-like protein